MKLLKVDKLEIPHSVIADWRQLIVNDLLASVALLVKVIIDPLKIRIDVFFGLFICSH